MYRNRQFITVNIRPLENLAPSKQILFFIENDIHDTEGHERTCTPTTRRIVYSRLLNHIMISEQDI